MRLVDYVVAEVERRWQDGESTQWELQPEALFEFEQDSVLSSLFRRWQDAAPEGGGLPTKGAFDPSQELARLDQLTCAEHMVIRVTLDGRDAGSAVSPSEAPDSQLNADPKEAAFLEYELQAVLLHAAPRYHHVDQIVEGQHTVFSRLLLPVINKDGKIVEVLLVQNPQMAAVVEQV